MDGGEREGGAKGPAPGPPATKAGCGTATAATSQRIVFLPQTRRGRSRGRCALRPSSVETRRSLKRVRCTWLARGAALAGRPASSAAHSADRSPRTGAKRYRPIPRRARPFLRPRAPAAPPHTSPRGGGLRRPAASARSRRRSGRLVLRAAPRPTALSLTSERRTPQPSTPSPRPGPPPKARLPRPAPPPRADASGTSPSPGWSPIDPYERSAIVLLIEHAFCVAVHGRRHRPAPGQSRRAAVASSASSTTRRASASRPERDLPPPASHRRRRPAKSHRRALRPVVPAGPSSSTPADGSTRSASGKGPHSRTQAGLSLSDAVSRTGPRAPPAGTVCAPFHVAVPCASLGLAYWSAPAGRSRAVAAAAPATGIGKSFPSCRTFFRAAGTAHSFSRGRRFGKVPLHTPGSSPASPEPRRPGRRHGPAAEEKAEKAAPDAALCLQYERLHQHRLDDALDLIADAGYAGVSVPLHDRLPPRRPVRGRLRGRRPSASVAAFADLSNLALPRWRRRARYSPRSAQPLRADAARPVGGGPRARRIEFLKRAIRICAPVRGASR